MHLTYLIVLLLAVLVLNWRFLGLDRLFGVGRRPSQDLFPWGKSCRWRLDPTQKGQERQRYVCRHCGADAFTTDGRPPRNCMRAARPTGL